MKVKKNQKASMDNLTGRGDSLRRMRRVVMWGCCAAVTVVAPIAAVGVPLAGH